MLALYDWAEAKMLCMKINCHLFPDLHAKRYGRSMRLCNIPPCHSHLFIKSLVEILLT